LLFGLALGGSLLVAGCSERRVRNRFAHDLETRTYPGTGLTLAAAVIGGIHDVDTNTNCRTTSHGEFRNSDFYVTCTTSRLTVTDGRGRTLEFKVETHGLFEHYYLKPSNEDAREALSKAAGRAITDSPFSEFLAYDQWLLDVRSRWKGLASSIAESRSGPGLTVDAVVRLLADGGRPLAAVETGFAADASVISDQLYAKTAALAFQRAAPDSGVHPVDQAKQDFLAGLSLARPSYKLRALRFAFTDEPFFARHGAAIIAGALTPHCRNVDWEKEAATIVARGLATIEACKTNGLACEGEVTLEAVDWWPSVKLEKVQQELRVIIPGEGSSN
jgi:hypothetical protein